MDNISVHVFQASKGDSFLITISEEEEINILIDCGLEETYKQHIKPVLLSMKSEGRKLDYLILTHTHSDHIGGAIPFLIDNKSFEQAEVIRIDNILYNGFLGLSLEKYETKECNAYEKLIYRGICAKGKSILANSLGQEAITLNEELCLSKLI